MENAEKFQEVLVDNKKAVDNKKEVPDDVQPEVELSNDTIEEASTFDNEKQPEESKTWEVMDETDTRDGTEEVSETKGNTLETEDTDPASDYDHFDWEENFDFGNISKQELLIKIKEIGGERNMRRVDCFLKTLKPGFDELYEAEKAEALEKFKQDGNEPDAFEYHGDDIDKEFLTLYKQLRTKRNNYFKDLKNQKEENLKQKEQILARIRGLVDGEESNSTFNEVKRLQEEWKKTGSVTGTHTKILWANYNALLDRFYDKRSIYFELKDLDRKKNLILKQELCERAEALVNERDIQIAILQLNELHDKYKHIGGVPKEDQEALWQRFKVASDAVYARRKDYFEKLKEEFDVNLDKKQALVQEAEQFVNFTSEQFSDWNRKTREIQEVQAKWEAIGGIPKDKAKAVNKQFWGSFKTFFHHKNQFFKGLESMRENNLKLKEELITIAEGLKDSEDWDATARKLKDLQTRWKNIGSVPEKVRNEIYQHFKAACDYFFNKKRQQNQEQNRGFEENLAVKLQICNQLESIASGDELDLNDIYDLVDNYSQIGFVPRNAIKKAQTRYEEVTQNLLAHTTMTDDDQMDLKNYIQISKLRNSPGGDRKMHRKESSIKRKIFNLESDINAWKTNMDSFASSAAADKLKGELQQRLDNARKELENLKSQLDVIG